MADTPRSKPTCLDEPEVPISPYMADAFRRGLVPA